MTGIPRTILVWTLASMATSSVGAQQNAAIEPAFTVTKTVESCESFAANTYRCVYRIRIENTGAPYAGDLQIEDVTNHVVNRFFLFDAHRNPLDCQVFTEAQPQQLEFADGTITSQRFDVCTMEGASIDASTPLELTALAQLGGPASSPADPPLNCAVVVMWDGRPDTMATEDFASSCVDALTPAPTADPGLPSARDTEFAPANWRADHCPHVDVGRGSSSFTAGQTVADGNPAPAYAVSHEYNLRIALCHIYQGGEIMPGDVEIGSLNFAFDARGTDRGSIAISPLLFQDGIAYWTGSRASVRGSLSSYSEALTATNFTPVYSGQQSTQHPDFGCNAATISIGFVTANQTGPGSTPTQNMHERSAVLDNWAFEATPGADC